MWRAGGESRAGRGGLLGRGQRGGGGGAVAGWQVGSFGEAQAAVRAGCDYVVAQGIEAGGNVRGTQPLEQVLLEVLSAVEVPVVAAGGIGSADRVSGVLALGASAVRV